MSLKTIKFVDQNTDSVAADETLANNYQVLFSGCRNADCLFGSLLALMAIAAMMRRDKERRRSGGPRRTMTANNNNFRAEVSTKIRLSSVLFPFNLVAAANHIQPNGAFYSESARKEELRKEPES